MEVRIFLKVALSFTVLAQGSCHCSQCKYEFIMLAAIPLCEFSLLPDMQSFLRLVWDQRKALCALFAVQVGFSFRLVAVDA